MRQIFFEIDLEKESKAIYISNNKAVERALLTNYDPEEHTIMKQFLKIE